jgi:hypothetical protein
VSGYGLIDHRLVEDAEEEMKTIDVNSRIRGHQIKVDTVDTVRGKRAAKQSSERPMYTRTADPSAQKTNDALVKGVRAGTATCYGLRGRSLTPGRGKTPQGAD